MNCNIDKRKQSMENIINEMSFQFALAKACDCAIFDVIIPRSYSLFLNQEDLKEISNYFKIAFEHKYMIIPLIYKKSNKNAMRLKFYKKEK